ncbi:alpha/beta hydrolase [Thermoflavimicrobium dichotomicum]|nr:alpha/beta hydrolase [Thermoflavimicrobium dichotomicum]
MISFTYPSLDGTKIAANKWLTGQKAKGVVQIAHGMAEHSRRYHAFATFLTREGYMVYANDHRGHGETAGSKENLGYFADENGWEQVVDDLHELTKIIKKEQPGLPVFLLGHSMGSFLSRRYIQKYGNEVAGVILSGTGSYPGLLGDIGRLLAKWIMRWRGKKARSKLFHQLSFGKFNKPFKPNRTPFDWLTRDEKEVDRYMEDPYCGELATISFYHDLLMGMKEMDQPDRLRLVPKDLPIFFISGEKDPVGHNTKGVLETIHRYQQAGITNLCYKFYKEARHEILNELNREEVYQDIVRWLNKQLNPARELEM